MEEEEEVRVALVADAAEPVDPEVLPLVAVAPLPVAEEESEEVVRGPVELAADEAEVLATPVAVADQSTQIWAPAVCAWPRAEASQPPSRQERAAWPMAPWLAQAQA